MPYGEEITINVGDAVRIHPNYVNYKFKKLLYGETYFVKELHTDYTKKVKVLETESGFLIRLNMDKRYFEHAGKEVVLEPTYERNYELFIGDVVLVTTSGYGLVDEDEGKYVEVIGKGNYFDDPGVEVKPYQCVLETINGCGSIGDQGVIGYESFGTAPMILLNTKESDEDTLVGKDFQVMGQGAVYKIHALDELHYNVTVSGEEVCAESARHRKSDVRAGFNNGIWVLTSQVVNIETTDHYTTDHYNLYYTLTEKDIEAGKIKVDAYWVAKQWKTGSRDDSGALWHSLKTIARFGEKNDKAREIKALYNQAKALARIYDVEL